MSDEGLKRYFFMQWNLQDSNLATLLKIFSCQFQFSFQQLYFLRVISVSKRFFFFKDLLFNHARSYTFILKIKFKFIIFFNETILVFLIKQVVNTIFFQINECKKFITLSNQLFLDFTSRKNILKSFIFIFLSIF